MAYVYRRWVLSKAVSDLDLEGQAFNPLCRISVQIRYTDWKLNEKHGEWRAMKIRLVGIELY